MKYRELFIDTVSNSHLGIQKYFNPNIIIHAVVVPYFISSILQVFGSRDIPDLIFTQREILSYTSQNGKMN